MVGMPADKLPLGEPMLAWSFNRDGEALPELVEQRDRRLRIDSRQIRKDRADLKSAARPQSGVDALKGAFARPTTPIDGVLDSQPAQGSEAPASRSSR